MEADTGRSLHSILATHYGVEQAEEKPCPHKLTFNGRCLDCGIVLTEVQNEKEL